MVTHYEEGGCNTFDIFCKQGNIKPLPHGTPWDYTKKQPQSLFQYHLSIIIIIIIVIITV